MKMREDPLGPILLLADIEEQPIIDKMPNVAGRRRLNIPSYSQDVQMHLCTCFPRATRTSTTRELLGA